MRAGLVSLVLLSVALSALSQIALKAGMISQPVRAAIATSKTMSVVATVAQSWLVRVGLTCFDLSALV
jgi:hypothetical protein